MDGDGALAAARIVGRESEEKLDLEPVLACAEGVQVELAGL